jgi:hypothetical protein
MSKLAAGELGDNGDETAGLYWLGNVLLKSSLK